MHRTRQIGLLGALLLLASGCSGLEYEDTDDLWTESDKHFDSGRYAEAIPYYDELLRRDEDNVEARVRRGVSRERTGEAFPALEDYGQLSEEGDVRGLLYSADLHIRRGELQLAENDLTRLRDMGLKGRDRVVQLVLLGTLRYEQGQTSYAVTNFEQAIGEGSSYGDGGTRRHVLDAHYNAAGAYFDLQDYGRAYDHMLAYIEGAPAASGEDYFNMAICAHLAGDFQTRDEYLPLADPALVRRAAEELDDPSFGGDALLAGGGEEWNQ